MSSLVALPPRRPLAPLSTRRLTGAARRCLRPGRRSPGPSGRRPRQQRGAIADRPTRRSRASGCGPWRGASAAQNGAEPPSAAHCRRSGPASSAAQVRRRPRHAVGTGRHAVGPGGDRARGGGERRAAPGEGSRAVGQRGRPAWILRAPPATPAAPSAPWSHRALHRPAPAASAAPSPEATWPRLPARLSAPWRASRRPGESCWVPSASWRGAGGGLGVGLGDLVEPGVHVLQVALGGLVPREAAAAEAICWLMYGTVVLAAALLTSVSLPSPRLVGARGQDRAGEVGRDGEDGVVRAVAQPGRRVLAVGQRPSRLVVRRPGGSAPRSASGRPPWAAGRSGSCRC